jgi:hypothetical protein
LSKEFDTSWFDLNNYEEFKTMTILQWSLALQTRRCMRDFNLSPERLKKDPAQTSSKNELFDDYVPAPITLAPKFPFNTKSVCSMTNYNIFRDFRNMDDAVIAACVELDNSIHRSFDKDESNHIDEDAHFIAHHPYDICRNYTATQQQRSAVICINLMASEDQIRDDFNHWLINYRKHLEISGRKKPLTKKDIKIGNLNQKEKPFTQKDFDSWVEYKVIPYLDLTLLAEYEGKKITQDKMSKLLYPNEYDVDLIDRLNKVTRVKANELIKFRADEELWAKS